MSEPIKTLEFYIPKHYDTCTVDTSDDSICGNSAVIKLIFNDDWEEQMCSDHLAFALRLAHCEEEDYHESM